jgi:dihydrolipoamide dehydrogenase
LTIVPVAAAARDAEAAGAEPLARVESQREPLRDVPAQKSTSRVSADVPHDRAVQLVVLGAGPGGYTAAFRAADLGLQVVLIERWPMLGGVCLNVGCIPSKALLHAAKVIDEAADMRAHGVEFSVPKIDIDKLRA